jgi:alkylhydroperoxidase/carboxymuconolactone decarboxylase family protein YurZ
MSKRSCRRSITREPARIFSRVITMAKKPTTQPKSRSTKLPKAPKAYRGFVKRFPSLARAWDSINEAGADGPLDPRTRRLVKIAAAMGAMREGAVRSGARKAIAEGIPLAEIEQLVPLAAGTIGLPSAVACWSWVLDAVEQG